MILLLIRILITAQIQYSKHHNGLMNQCYMFQLLLNLWQAAIFKLRIQHKKLRNMFYTGQLTTPGPSVPENIISGLVTAKEIYKQSDLL